MFLEKTNWLFLKLVKQKKQNLENLGWCKTQQQQKNQKQVYEKKTTIIKETKQKPL